MSKALKILLGVLVFLSLASLPIVYFLATNTSFLNFDISDEDIEENNSNNEVESEERDLLNLVEQKITVNGEEQILNLPEDFEVSVFASGLGAPRGMDMTTDRSIFVTDKEGGNVWLVRPDGEKVKIASGLRNVHGIDFYNDKLYVAEEHQVVVFSGLNKEATAFATREILIKNLPKGGHSTRTIVIGPDEKIYLSIGSSCNVCVEEDERRAAIMQFNLDGTGGRIYAKGLRNAVGMHFAPDGKLWTVNNGRDLLGDDLPGEEVDIIEEGGHYGWPYCYGDRIVDPGYKSREGFCKNDTKGAVYEMQAHSAPLGLDFVASDNAVLPEELRNNLIIGFHGSWNRTVPTGYKVVRLDTSNPDSKTVDFVTGWLDKNGNVWGRPVDVVLAPDGTIYVSDDQAGVIYKIRRR